MKHRNGNRHYNRWGAVGRSLDSLACGNAFLGRFTTLVFFEIRSSLSEGLIVAPVPGTLSAGGQLRSHSPAGGRVLARQSHRHPHHGRQSDPSPSPSVVAGMGLFAGAKQNNATGIASYSVFAGSFHYEPGG